MSERRSWRFTIRHSCDRQVTYDRALDKLAALKKKSPISVECGPLSPDGANVFRITFMGESVLIGVYFEDGLIACSISAPSSFEWAEMLVREKAEKMVRGILEDAGSEYVEIDDMS